MSPRAVPCRWGFDATGQRIIKGKMKQAGRAKDALAGRIEQLDAAAAASDSDSARKAGRQANNLRELQPHVKNVNVTLQTAADRRGAFRRRHPALR